MANSSVRVWRRLAAETLESRCLLAAGVFLETGDLLAEVQRLKELVFERDSNAYVAPSASDQVAFDALASSLRAGDLDAAVQNAEMLDYEVVEFTDTSNGEVYHLLREELIGGQTARGWGSYIAKLDYQVEALVEVPHPLFDTNSWEIGANVFRQSQARGFLMAGAHRHANGSGTADVAHLDESIFQTVHRVWNGADGMTPAWQIHGFSRQNHEEVPEGAELVSSHGDGSLSDNLVHLDQAFESVGALSFSYNTLAADSDLNLEVNDGIDGKLFGAFAGQTNVQGQHSRNRDGEFIHLDFERSIRFDADRRELASTVLSDTMATEASFFVESAELSDQRDQLIVHLSEEMDASTVAAADLRIDGHLALSVITVDINTLLFELPTLSEGSYTAAIDHSALSSATQVGINEYRLPFDVSPAPSNGTKFYVVDTSDDATFEYSATGDLLEGYSLAVGNTMPRGAASDSTGTTLWVVDNDDFVYVYDGDGNSLGHWKAIGLDRPEGIATDGQHLWIVDRGADETYFFEDGAERREGTIAATSNIALTSANYSPRGITTDGNHLWVVNDGSSVDRIFKYSVDGTYLGRWNIDAANSSPRGVTIDPSDPSQLWIVDNQADAIFAYPGGGARTFGSQAADEVYLLLGTNPQGIADPPVTRGVHISTAEADALAEAVKKDVRRGNERSVKALPRQHSVLPREYHRDRHHDTKPIQKHEDFWGWFQNNDWPLSLIIG